MSKKNKILIAEDDEIIRKIVKEVIGESYDLVMAEDGDTAIKLARQHMPDLILLDVMMPETNGFEVCKEIRTIDGLEKTIIIMISALSDKDSEKTGLKAGADDFITKPFNPVELRTKIKLMFRLRDRLLKN
jgi:DNA-binding response OmpR family regulator